MFGNRNGGEGMGGGVGCGEGREVEGEFESPARVRTLPPSQFCRHGFVLGKATEAGFGNEMYKILTAAALSIMLIRSLIIGQSRHIGSLAHLSIDNA
ncbi:hypothetical protein AKJ16_DCAP11107 [Drosera capensis]